MGWVERSETHRWPRHRLTGFASLNSSYTEAAAKWLTSRRTTSRTSPMPRLQPISFFFDRQQRLRLRLLQFLLEV